MDPNTFLGSVWGMIWGVSRIFSGGVWIHSASDDTISHYWRPFNEWDIVV